MATAKCQGCGREIHANWTLCRVCAVAHVRGTAVYLEPCPDFKPDLYWPVIASCSECGFEGSAHPGEGKVGLVVSF